MQIYKVSFCSIFSVKLRRFSLTLGPNETIKISGLGKTQFSMVLSLYKAMKLIAGRDILDDPLVHQ